MESERRRSRVRKPLSDCTNRIAATTIKSSQSSSSSSSFLFRKPQNPILSSAFAKLLSDLAPKSAQTAPENDGVSARNVSVLPPPVSSTPSRPPRSPSASGRVDCEVFEPHSVYTRRQTAEKLKCKVKQTEGPLDNTSTAKKSKSKGNVICEPISCLPATKIQKIGLLSGIGPKSAKTAHQKNDANSVPHVLFLPPAVSSTPSRPLISSSASGRVDCEVFEPCSVYTRSQTAEKLKSKAKQTEEHLDNTLTAEKRKSKGKAIDEPLSCLTKTKIQKIGEKIKEDGSKSLSKASTVPCKKKQSRKLSSKDSAKNVLSQDYIEQQRAYFAEIDAFELPEEEVESVSDLD